MELISIEDLNYDQQRHLGTATFKKDFNAAWQMTDFMLTLQRKSKKIKSDGVIYWHSNHHQILLWLDREHEKYLTILLI
jgi:hypothetical protein